MEDCFKAMETKKLARHACISGILEIHFFLHFLVKLTGKAAMSLSLPLKRVREGIRFLILKMYLIFQMV